MVGTGYWLNPSSGEAELASAHEDWIKQKASDPAQAAHWGIPQSALELTDADELRLLGIKAGLVRIRIVRSDFTAQFAVERYKVRNVLWALQTFIEKHSIRPYYMRLNNLQYNDWAEMEYKTFAEKLKMDEPILREGYRDLSPESFQEFLKKREENGG